MTMVSSGPIYLGGNIEQGGSSTTISRYTFPIATENVTTGAGRGRVTTTYYGFFGGTISPSASIDVGSGTISELTWTASGSLVLGITGAGNSGWTNMYLNGRIWPRTSATYSSVSGVGTWTWSTYAPKASGAPSDSPILCPFPFPYSTYVDGGFYSPGTPDVGLTVDLAFTGVAVGNVSTSINESVALEIGDGPTTTEYANSSAVATLAGVSPGATLYFSYFYGKSSTFVYSYSLPAGIADVDFNLTNRLISAGWNGTSPVQATISISGILGSTSAATYAFDTGTGYPAGSTISVTVNSGGYITGAGGGTPGWNAAAWNGGNSVASNGGNAMHVQVPITLTNNGIISGGGGSGNVGSNPFSGGGSGFFVGGYFYQAGVDGWIFATLDSGSSFSYDTASGSANGGAGGGWVAANSGESVANSVNGTGNSSPGTGDSSGGQSAGIYVAGSAIVGRTNCNPVVPAQATTVKGTHYRGQVQ